MDNTLRVWDYHTLGKCIEDLLAIRTLRLAFILMIIDDLPVITGILPNLVNADRTFYVNKKDLESSRFMLQNTME